ncbi:MAG: class I SAM-dependent methyltransferase [Nitrospinota bacterium]|nr:class I SAM-dependent methyltransferase [Nitrospinota bacterium]
MDLVESEIFSGLRHPWETARVEAVRALLQDKIRPGAQLRALDLGCGDGFVAEQLFGREPGAHAVLVDTGFTDSVAGRMDDHGGRFSFHGSLDKVGDIKFDLALMLDVLEHAEDDLGLLSAVASRLEDDGSMLITVPAFQALFSSHDIFLKHFRRYSLGQLLALAERAGLSVQRSGYLFSSLLLPRAMAAMAQKLGLGGGEAKGVGGWTGGAFVTGLISGALKLDNRALIALAGAGIKLPGLTAWMICQKQR